MAQLSIWQAVVADWKRPPGNGHGQAFPVGLCRLAFLAQEGTFLSSWPRTHELHLLQEGSGGSAGCPGVRKASWAGQCLRSMGNCSPAQPRTAGILSNRGSAVRRSSSILCSDPAPPCRGLVLRELHNRAELLRASGLLGLEQFQHRLFMLTHCLYVQFSAGDVLVASLDPPRVPGP